MGARSAALPSSTPPLALPKFRLETFVAGISAHERRGIPRIPWGGEFRVGTGAGRCRAVLIEFYRAVCIEYHPVIEPRPDENAHIQRVVTGLTWLIRDEH